MEPEIKPTAKAETQSTNNWPQYASHKKPKPIDKEASFSVEELFFSITDKRGIILTGNNVFARISGYSQDVLIGAPHNIIRHPDMPKVVFKLLWDTILGGQPICAYVKNMAKDGSYYWVFASVFPISGDRFLSVRLKPLSPIKGIVESVYQKALPEEKKGGVQASAELILGALSGLGFASYPDFMTHALIAEINARKERMTQEGKTISFHSEKSNPEIDRIKGLGQDCIECVNEYAEAFKVIQEFGALNKVLSGSLSTILTSFENLRLLSINISISATHIGKMAYTLAVIAESFQKMSGEIYEQLNRFSESIKKVKEQLRVSEFNIAGARLQLEMTGYFLSEMISTFAQGDGGSAEAVGELKENCKLLSGLCLTTSKSVYSICQDLKSVLGQFNVETADLETSIGGLEIIRQTGKVESVQLKTGSESMEVYIEEMEKFVQSIRTPMREISQATETLLKSVELMGLGIGSINQKLSVIDEKCRAL